MNAAKVTPMNKRERFITMVQTGLVVHYIKKANDNNTLGCHEGAIDHLELAYQEDQAIQKIGLCGRCQRWGANVFSVKGWRHVKCVRLDESEARQLACEMS